VDTLANHSLFDIRDPDGNAVHLRVSTVSDGSVKIQRSTTTDIAQSSAGVISGSGAQYFIELVFTIDDLSGVATLFVNGVQACTFSGDTRTAGNGTWTVLSSLSTGNNVAYSDVYICDAGDDDVLGSGLAALTQTLGGIPRTDPQYANGAGNSAQFTPSAGSNYENVDENPHDSDTTYNASSTPTHKDTFTHENLVNAGSALIASTDVTVARKDAEGLCLLRTVRRQSGTDYESVDLVPVTTYRHLRGAPRTLNPGTGVGWTEAGWNGGETGYIKSA
jgi:hypothetical protein